MATQSTSASSPPAVHPSSMLLALERVLSPAGFPYASGYHLFKDALFGRDSLEVAEDLLEIRPDIARSVIMHLAALQGIKRDIRTEEEPGKIHHEHRALVMGGHVIDDESKAIFRRLAQNWELAATPAELDALSELTIYPTVDATPLYVRLVADYCTQFGPAILSEKYTSRTATNSPHSIESSVRRAIEWIARALERSSVGLLEFQRMTPHGHPFQAWKDGGTSYLHVNGTVANFNAPIASIEVQGLAYDALIAAPALLKDAGDDERARWATLANRVREKTLDLFWMPDEKYFAMALDRDPETGRVRQVKAITSNPGALLDSGIFDVIDAERRRRLVSAIVDRIYSDEFLTSAGIRVTSILHKDLLDYMAYQSSYTVWHKETYDVAKGLRRQGFPCLATDLETRLLNAVNLTGGATEFLYVLPDGRVDVDPFDRSAEPAVGTILGTNVPENDQAWTISAALMIKWRRGHRQKPVEAREVWQRELEARKEREIPATAMLRTLAEIERARGESDVFRLDRREGWRREQEFARAHGLALS